MYKKQMTLQKVICLLAIVASVVCFIYALGLMTDVYDGLSPVQDAKRVGQMQKMFYRNWPKGEPYPDTNFEVYQEMQPFNRTLLVASLGLILLSVLLFITNTFGRRRYYIGNYIAVGLNAVAQVAAVCWIHVQVTGFRAAYALVNQEFLAFVLQRQSKEFVYSTFWFDAHYAVMALSILAAVLLVLNAIWKTLLMKQEKQLIDAGKKEQNEGKVVSV